MKYLIVSIFLFSIMQGFSQPGYEAERSRMVEEQIRRRAITDTAVLMAMQKVPRHKFVPEKYRSEAYEDHPLPIGYGQTISQPYIVAFMTQVLEPKKTDRILEVGTGSGYQAAVLAEICDSVYTIELVEDLAKRAEETIKGLGYNNVSVRAGDGYQGWPEHAPFDAIIVTCAPTHVPELLEEQLAEGGRMIIPVGKSFAQELVLLEKKNGKLKQNDVLPVRFVPMLDNKGGRY